MQTFTSRSVLLASLFAAAGSASTASAQLIAYDGFNYPAASPLNVTGNGGFGWAAPWSPSYGSSWMIDSVGSGYAAGGFSLQRVGRRIVGTHGGSQRSIALGSPLGNTTETVWVSFIAQQSSGSTNQNWLGVKLPCTPGSGVDQFLFLGKPYTRAAWGLDPGGFSRHLVGSSSVFNKSFIVAKIDLRPGLDDVRVWVNPGLNGVPSNASASVTALNVGNFQGITKAIAEVGSNSGLTAGNIDELRIGRSFADVAPKVDGVLFMGRQVTALGAAQIAQNNGALAVFDLGGTGNDGIRIDMSSLGNALQVDTGTLVNGQSFSLAHFNSNNLRIASNTVQRTSAGLLQFLSDFSDSPGAPVESVQMTVYDDNGNITNQATFPGTTGSINLDPQMMDLPCPGGGSRYWYQTFESVPSLTFHPNNIRLVWRYGCGEGAINQAQIKNCVVIDAAISNSGGGGGTGNVDDKNPTRIQATGVNIDDFTILRASSLLSGADVSGLGNASLTEACPDGFNCSDSAQRRIAAHLGNSSGEDGVFLRPADGSPVEELSLGLDLSASLAGTLTGEITHTLDVTTTAGQPAQITAKMQLTDDNRLKITLDASLSGEPALNVAVSNGGSTVGSHSGSARTIVVYVDGFPVYSSESWFLVWHFINNFLSFSITPPPGPSNPTFTITDDAGFFSLAGDHLSFSLGGVAPVSSASGLAVTGINLAGPLTLSDVSFGQSTPPCPADFNQDGFLDGFDYDDFVAAFEGQGPGNADFNQDGFTDGFDYDEFVNAFELGC